jgi:hypothetical protein
LAGWLAGWHVHKACTQSIAWLLGNNWLMDVTHASTIIKHMKK